MRKIRPMQLALFDLDHTLLPIDSADTWSHHVVRRGGLDAEVYGARIRHFAQTYQAGTFDVEGYVRFQMELLARFPRASLDAWHAEFMEQSVRPHVRREARALVDRHRRAGDELALVTGTNAYVVTPIAREFGIEHVLAVEPEAANGEFTGGWRRDAHLPGRQGAQGGGVAGRGAEWAGRACAPSSTATRSTTCRCSSA